jgi:RNA recognition motif-containing protein
MKRLYVGNLSFDSTEDDVRSAFSAFGEVSSVHMVTDRDTGRPRGFGFVEMADSEAAENAINGLNGSQLGGRTLTVNEARPRPERRAARW